MNPIRRHGGYGSDQWMRFYFGYAAAIIVGAFLRRHGEKTSA